MIPPAFLWFLVAATQAPAIEEEQEEEEPVSRRRPARAKVRKRRAPRPRRGNLEPPPPAPKPPRQQNLPRVRLSPVETTSPGLPPTQPAPRQKSPAAQIIEDLIRAGRCEQAQSVLDHAIPAALTADERLKLQIAIDRCVARQEQPAPAPAPKPKKRKRRRKKAPPPTTAEPEPAEPEPEPAEPEPEPEPEPAKPAVVVVQQGEGLSQVAQRLGRPGGIDDVRELRKANIPHGPDHDWEQTKTGNLGKPGRPGGLQPGDRLFVPEGWV